MAELVKHPDFDTFAGQLEHTDLTDPAAAIASIPNRVRLVRVEIDGSQARRLTQFVSRRIGTPTHPQQQPLLNDLLTLARSVSVGLWFSCEDTSEVHWPKILQVVQCLPNSFTDYLANCRAGDYQDPVYANIAEIPDDGRPERPAPAVMIFQDNEHCTLRYHTPIFFFQGQLDSCEMDNG